MLTTASLSRSFPTFRWIVAPFRWIGQSRRRIWCTVSALLAMIAAPPVWWATQLAALPDIGDPFDVAEFRRFTIPDDRNAFIPYREAASSLKPWEPYQKTLGNRVDMLAPWSKAIPQLRQWAEENREALTIFRKGSERPDALDPVSPFDPTYRQKSPSLRFLHFLSLLEASRREEQGDMAGAGDWYRADLRAAHHLAMHGTTLRRMEAQNWRRSLQDRIAAWAANSRTTPALLRQALEDVVACESLAVSESYTLKAEYVWIDQTLKAPKSQAGEVPSMKFRGILPPEYQLTPEQLQDIWDAWRFWRREPERSRRVIRLMIANWLAYYEMPPDLRPKPDWSTNSAYALYPFGPDTPANARKLSPQSLDRWFRIDLRRQRPAGLLDLESSTPPRVGRSPGPLDPPGDAALPPRPRGRSSKSRGARRSLPQAPAR